MEKRLVQNLLHKELSYALHGAAIEVRKDFGPGHKEKLYQEAFARELERRKILFEKEKSIKIYSPKDGKYIGLYRPDFIIDKKIIIETKAEKFVNRDEIKRIYDYLRNSEYELAYFINFASPRLHIKRIILTNDRKPFLKKFLVSISLILVLFSGLPVQAAQLNLISQFQEIAVDQQFQVDLILDTENEDINAVEGKIIFSETLLKIKEIRDGNSIINFWVERPKASGGEILFSGIIPGGYSGKKGLIFSLVFQSTQEGGGLIEVRDIKALLNDGEGTETDTIISNLQFVISEQAPPSQPIVSEKKDTDMPEVFEPTVASDPTIFDGKYFLVFATQDKGSGIDHYEVLENRKQKIENRRWVRTESPYVLKDQDLRSYIYVKAVDKMGNERIAMLPPQKPLRWYENLIIWIIIILGVIVLYIIGKILWKKKLTR